MMTTLPLPIALRLMALRLKTAGEIMTPSPLAFDTNMPIQKAYSLLRWHGLEAAPVIDESGRVVGVVTAESCAVWEEFSLRSSRQGGVPDRCDTSTVLEISSPALESVPLSMPSREVIDALVERPARRIYVANFRDKLVGVISASDVLRHLTEDSERCCLSSTWAAHSC